MGALLLDSHLKNHLFSSTPSTTPSAHTSGHLVLLIRFPSGGCFLSPFGLAVLSLGFTFIIMWKHLESGLVGVL